MFRSAFSGTRSTLGLSDNIPFSFTPVSSVSLSAPPKSSAIDRQNRGITFDDMKINGLVFSHRLLSVAADYIIVITFHNLGPQRCVHVSTKRKVPI